MFQILNHQKDNLDYIILQNSDKSTFVEICLNEGARVKTFTCNNVPIIKEINNFTYKTSYASSILFPFASRIKNGKYSFLGEDYQLKKNDNNINALHGLVFDKSFEIFEPEIHQNNCSVTLNYFEKQRNNGFPFTYFISVTYTLFENKLRLRTTIKNTDTIPFPFILGWHPYFFSEDLYNSSVILTSDKKVVFDENLITKEIIKNTEHNTFLIKDKQLDDCFFLKDTKVHFMTPKYDLQMTSFGKQNFLQLYIPKDLPIIAIEPMTGISNSFNNKIGLKVLEPEESYAITWDVDIKIN